MSINESDSSLPQINQEDELEITESNQSLTKAEPDQKQPETNILAEICNFLSDNASIKVLIISRIFLFTSLSITITLISIIINNLWLGILGTLATLLLSLLIIYPWWQDIIKQWFAPEDRNLFIGFIGLIVAIIGLFRFSNLGHSLLLWGKRINWEASGTLAEW
ncbi:MAG: pentapeptide repeat-containing protein, partial [Dolichospermum sp.]